MHANKVNMGVMPLNMAEANSPAVCDQRMPEAADPAPGKKAVSARCRVPAVAS